MITPKELARAYALDLNTVKEQTKGLTHADSILQPPVRGNCMNWVLGHVVDTRSTVLQLLGQSPIITEAQAKRYGYGSEPVCADGEDILKLETMVSLIEQSQEKINAAMESITEEQLSKKMNSFMGEVTVGFFLLVMYHHESYHLGQTEILRELALTNK